MAAHDSKVIEDIRWQVHIIGRLLKQLSDELDEIEKNQASFKTIDDARLRTVLSEIVSQLEKEIGHVINTASPITKLHQDETGS